MGHEAAGGGDDEVCLAGEGSLFLVPGNAVAAAVDGFDAGVGEVRKAFGLLGNLNGQLPRGAQDQGFHPCTVDLRQVVEERQQEGGSFSGAGLGATDEVVAFQDERNGFGLDLGGFGVVHVVHRVQ